MPAYAVGPDMDKGMGRGENFSWTGDILVRLPEEVYSSAVFPLWALDANIVLRHSEPLDAPVCGPHQIYDGPTLDVSACSGVGLQPL